MNVSNSAWEQIVIITCIIATTLLLTVFTVSIIYYYHFKVVKMTEMVKAGASPMEVRCALYQSCPQGGITIELMKYKIIQKVDKEDKK